MSKLQFWTRFRRPAVAFGVNFEEPQHFMIWISLLFFTVCYVN